MLLEFVVADAVVLALLFAALALYAWQELREWVSGFSVTIGLGKDPHAFFNKLLNEGHDFHRITPGSMGGRKSYMAFEPSLVKDIYTKGTSSTSSRLAAQYFDYAVFGLSKTWLQHPEVYEELEPILYRAFAANGIEEPGVSYKQHFENYMDDLERQVQAAEAGKKIGAYQDLMFDISKCLNLGFFGPDSDAEGATRAMRTFERDFELIGATSILPLPFWLSRKLIAARPWQGLLDARAIFQKWLDNDQHKAAVGPWRDVLDEMRDKYVARGQLKPQDPAAIACAIAFASTSNTSPVAFWTLLHIISSPDLLARVRKELQELRDRDDPSELTVAKLPQSCPLTRSTFHEVLRHYVPPFGVRQVIKDASFVGKSGKPLVVKAGNCIMLNGVWSHLQADRWPDYDVFKADRFLDDDGKFYIPTDLFAFGGGIGICRGRQLAQHEVIYTVLRLIETFDFELGKVTDKAGKVVEPAVRKMGDGHLAKLPHMAPNRFGSGAIPPTGDIELTLRLRK